MTPTPRQQWPIKRIRFVTQRGPSDQQRRLSSQVSQVTFVPMEAVGEQGELDLSAVRDIEDVRLGYTQFFDGDVLIAKITPCFENGKGALVSGTVGGVGFGTTELHVLTPGPDLDGRFLYFTTASLPFRRLGEASMTGAAGQKRVPEDFVRDFRIPIPPLPQQRAIANYLDRETAQLDGLVAAKKRVLRLLAEKRRALITRAVSRGLDPRAPLRNSGIPWLGEIPAHWDVIRLKHACSLIRDGTHLPPERTATGIPLLSVRNIVGEEFKTLPDDSFIAEEDYQELCRGFVVQKNDVLLAIVGATLGKVAIVGDMPRFHIQRSLATIRPNRGLLDFGFLASCLRSDWFQRNLWESVEFSAQPGIYLGALNDLSITRPPLPEQGAIAAHLASGTSKLDALHSATERTIALLMERRAALVAAAVTGQLAI